MLEILTSWMFWGTLSVSLILGGLLGYGCARLHQQFITYDFPYWLTEHLLCPLARLLAVMAISLLLFPQFFRGSDFPAFSATGFDPSVWPELFNISVIAALVFSFLPGLKHPLPDLPLLGCVVTSVLFHHQAAQPDAQAMAAIPPFPAVLWVLFWLLIVTAAGRWINPRIADWIDLKFLLSDSEQLVRDSTALVLAIPVILAYGLALSPT